jgi:hypothetical protein
LTPQVTDTDREAYLFFKAEKNQDGYFIGENLIKQVDQAIDIFDSKTNGFVTGLIMLLVTNNGLLALCWCATC